MKACLLFAAVLAWSAFTLHAQEAGAPVLHSLGPAHSTLDDCPVTFGRVLASSVKNRGHNYTMFVLVNPEEAKPDQMFLLSQWIEAHVPDRLNLLHAEFFTDVKAYQLHIKPLDLTTDEELDFSRAHWAGLFDSNSWTKSARFLFMRGEWDPVSIPLHPEVKPTGALGYIPEEFLEH